MLSISTTDRRPAGRRSRRLGRPVNCQKELLTTVGDAVRTLAAPVATTGRSRHALEVILTNLGNTDFRRPGL